MVTNTGYALRDIRDTNSYTVKKLDTGDVWMVEDLRLGYNVSNPNTTTFSLDSTTSNIAPTYTASNPLVFTLYDLVTYGKNHCSIDIDAGGTGYTDACIHSRLMNADYTYSGVSTPIVQYNFSATSATSFVGNNNMGTVQYSICPTGWTIPSKSQVDPIGDDTSKYKSIFQPVYANSYLDGTLGSEKWASWFTSTPYSTVATHSLYFYKNSNQPQGEGGLWTNNRGRGLPLRCIAQN